MDAGRGIRRRGRGGRGRIRATDIREQLFPRENHKNNNPPQKRIEKRNEASNEQASTSTRKPLEEKNWNGSRAGLEWSCARVRAWKKTGNTRSQDISLYQSVYNMNRRASPSSSDRDDEVASDSDDRVAYMSSHRLASPRRSPESEAYRSSPRLASPGMSPESDHEAYRSSHRRLASSGSDDGVASSRHSPQTFRDDGAGPSPHLHREDIVASTGSSSDSDCGSSTKDASDEAAIPRGGGNIGTYSDEDNLEDGCNEGFPSVNIHRRTEFGVVDSEKMSAVDRDSVRKPLQDVSTRNDGSSGITHGRYDGVDSEKISAVDRDLALQDVSTRNDGSSGITHGSYDEGNNSCMAGHSWMHNLSDLLSSMSVEDDSCGGGVDNHDDDPTHLSVFELTRPGGPATTHAHPSSRGSCSRSPNPLNSTGCAGNLEQEPPNSLISHLHDISSPPLHSTRYSASPVPPSDNQDYQPEDFLEDLKDDFDSDITDLSLCEIPFEGDELKRIAVSSRSRDECHDLQGSHQSGAGGRRKLTCREPFNPVGFKPPSFSTPSFQREVDMCGGEQPPSFLFRPSSLFTKDDDDTTRLPSQLSAKNNSGMQVVTPCRWGVPSRMSTRNSLGMQVVTPPRWGAPPQISAGNVVTPSGWSTAQDVYIPRSILKKKKKSDYHHHHHHSDVAGGSQSLKPQYAQHKQLSKSVTFNIPCLLDFSGSHGSSILAPETPEHLWCNISSPRGDGMETGNETEEKETPPGGSVSQALLEDMPETLNSPYHSILPHCTDITKSSCYGDCFHGDVPSIRASLEETISLTGMSILAMETPDEMWCSLPVNFIGDTQTRNYH